MDKIIDKKFQFYDSPIKSFTCEAYASHAERSFFGGLFSVAYKARRTPHMLKEVSIL